MMIIKLRRVLASLAVAGVFALAACGGGADATAVPPAATSTSVPVAPTTAPVPTATSAPAATSTPAPTATTAPAATATSAPTATTALAATAVPAPRATLAPTATVAPTATLAPTASLAPTATVAPTATTAPTPTTAPTATPTPIPSPTPVPTPTPFQSLRQQGATGVGAIDNRSLAQASVNGLFSCNASSLEDALGRPWVSQNGTISFADKPFVAGSVAWGSELKIVVSAGNRSLTGNGLPDHVTGVYPIASSSEAYVYDKNPNSIGSDNFDYTIPASPQIADEPTCLSLGPIGVALSGGVFLNALDADIRDAVANEIFDECEGHPAQAGTYHYHHGSPCIDTGQEGDHSQLAGYALDGFGIYGPLGELGVTVTNDDLDECHGHSGPVPLTDGSSATAYHYHLNEEFPYTLGCYRGTADIQESGGSGPGGGLPPPPGGGLPPRP